VATVLLCTTSNNALAAPFQGGDFITHSPDSWGSIRIRTANPS
jgi:hypothetical protein